MGIRAVKGDIRCVRGTRCVRWTGVDLLRPAANSLFAASNRDSLELLALLDLIHQKLPHPIHVVESYHESNCKRDLPQGHARRT